MTNPYELRYDIYQQARSTLMDKFHCDHALWENWQFADTPGQYGECPVKRRPVFPTHEEVLVEAENIYEFVKTQ